MKPTQDASQEQKSRDKYLELIRKAGFQEVKIIEEKTYPLEYIISESATQEIIKSLDMTLEEVKEAANSVVSVKVSAEKTKLVQCAPITLALAPTGEVWARFRFTMRLFLKYLSCMIMRMEINRFNAGNL